MNRQETPPSDIVVIGAGLAGLSAAAHLAQAGKQVVVIEQHDKPGGYYTSFVRNGIIFDITAHWTVAHESVNQMLTSLGARPITFVHHPKIGQYFGPGAQHGVLLVNDRDRFVRSILDTYPSVKKEAINRLIELSLQVEAEVRRVQMQSPELLSLPARTLMMIQALVKMRTLIKYSKTPGEEFLKTLFPGDELAGLRAALYMLAPIKNFSAIGMLLYIGFALQGRAFQPEGGAFKAAAAFAEAAVRNGAVLRFGERAASIDVEQGQVVGVTLASGEKIPARTVVSAADIRQTFFEFLDPTMIPPDFRKKLENTPLSGSFVIVSLVLDIDPSVYGFDDMDAFFNETTDIDAALTPDDPEHSLISLQFPEFRDQTGDPALFGLQLVAPASFEYHGHWATGPNYVQTDEYRKFKEDFADRLITRAERYMPGLRQHVVSMDIATPITLHRYTLNDAGAPVGWSYTSTQQWKQKVPFVKGLYLAGHWVGPSGIYNVAVSGRNAAQLILKSR